MLTVSTEERITVEEALNHRYYHHHYDLCNDDYDDDDDDDDDDDGDDDCDRAFWLFSFSAFYFCGSLFRDLKLRLHLGRNNFLPVVTREPLSEINSHYKNRPNTKYKEMMKTNRQHLVI